MAIRISGCDISISTDELPRQSCTACVYLDGDRRKRYLVYVKLKHISLTKAVMFIRDAMKNGWQDLERTWMDVDLVYETRWDCLTAPERVRQVA